MLLTLLACAAPGGGTPTPDDTAAPAVDPRLALDAPIACPAPRAAVSYTEVGGALGLVGPDTPDADHRAEGGAVAVDDLDADGDLDLVFAHEEDAVRVFWQRDGRFEEARIAGEGARFPILADLDGDGRRDLLVAGKTEARVLWNDAGTLVEGDVLPTEAGPLRGAAPADLDGDGDLDLVALRRGEASGALDTIVWNEGERGFREDTLALAPEAARRQGFDAGVFDWDGDGALDVYVANDMGPDHGPNVLWRNRGDGGFDDASEACACGRTMSAMGVSVADADRDGAADLYVTGVYDNVLLAGAPDGRFVDVTLARGADPVEGTDMAWGAAWFDHDNDGWLDLLVAEGDFGPGHAAGEPVRQPLRLLQQVDGAYVDASDALGADTDGLWRGALAIELNGDGVLDLLVVSHDDRPHLWRSDGCTAATWLAVEAPIGSVVRVTTGADVQTAWVTGHPGYGVSTFPHAWFGLGDAVSVDAIEVTLPWGAGTLRARGPLEARRWVRVRD